MENVTVNSIGINDLYEALCGVLDGSQVELNAPMKEYTTFRVGGPADLLVKPSSVQEAEAVISLIRLSRQPMFILGNGSNLLVRDKGIRGVVVRFGSDFSAIAVRGGSIRAQSGALMSSIAKAALQAGLTGFEFAAGIPGSIGGGLFMNAGAYGGELKNVISDALIMDHEGNIGVVFDDEMDLSYRHSAFEKNGEIIMEVGISLERGNKEEISALMSDYAARRSEKQPLNYGSAGSIFKRPEGHYAGKLIQDAGCMGMKCGDALVSDKHAGFIVNAGNATAKDVLDLIKQVQDKVKEKFDVMLETEVRIIGEE